MDASDALALLVALTNHPPVLVVDQEAVHVERNTHQHAFAHLRDKDAPRDGLEANLVRLVRPGQLDLLDVQRQPLVFLHTAPRHAAKRGSQVGCVGSSGSLPLGPRRRTSVAHA